MHITGRHDPRLPLEHQTTLRLRGSHLQNIHQSQKSNRIMGSHHRIDRPAQQNGDRRAKRLRQVRIGRSGSRAAGERGGIELDVGSHAIDGGALYGGAEGGYGEQVYFAGGIQIIIIMEKESRGLVFILGCFYGCDGTTN